MFVVWGFSVEEHWDHFSFQQLFGYSLMISGTAIYNNVIISN
jgi:hypothetical protein